MTGPPAPQALAAAPEAMGAASGTTTAAATPGPRRARVAGRLVYLLAALIALALLWATLADVDVRVAARGRLVNPSHNIVLRPLEAGVLREVHVSPGQVVRKGDVIATLDTTFAGADLSQLSVRDLALRAQVERLRRQAGDDAPRGDGSALGQVDEQKALLAEREAAHAARLRHFDERVARLRVARESTLADQRVLQERVTALQELETMLQQLSKENFGSQARMLEARERRLEVQRDLTVAQGRQAEIERDLRLADAERSTFVAESRRQVREELAQASRDSQEIGEQLQKARRRSELVTLVAPTDAVVLEIRQTSAGSVLTQSETFAVLVPLEGRLMAEADVAPEDVGEIRVGDAVRLKIDAFPFQRHGVLEGRVATISRDAFTPPAGEATRPAVSYRMRVELVSARFARGGEAQTLLPGMTLSAEAIVGRRSVLSYFLYPLIRTLDESIRER